MKGRIIFFLLLYVLVASLVVQSVGISPAFITIDFSPNFIQEYVYMIRNNAGEDVKVSFYLRENDFLHKYIAIPSPIEIAKDEAENVILAVKLPENISLPGNHRVYFGALEERTTSGLGARTAAESVIMIKVPYPGKYLDGVFSTPPKNIGEDIDLDLKLTHQGLDKIMMAKAKFIILNGEEEIPVNAPPEMEIEPGETRGILAHLQSPNLSEGYYKALAIVEYDGIVFNLTSFITIGKFYVELIDYTTHFEQGKINKLTLNVRNAWNNPIQELSAKIRIKDQNGTLVSELQTVPTTLQPKQTKKLESFWDLSNIPAGKYTAEITFTFDGNEAQERVLLTVVSPEQPRQSIPKYVIALVFAVNLAIIITLLNIFLLIRKRKEP